MEERTLLFKLLSLKEDLNPLQALPHEAFLSRLSQHAIDLHVPMLEALINVSSHYEAKTQTLWIHPFLFFEGVIQALSGKRSYKAEAGFWSTHFPGEDSIPWQQFAHSFLKVFREIYDPEEVKRVLLLLRTQAQTSKPLAVHCKDFLLFTKTCSLAPVRPALPPKTRQLSVTKLQYAKLLFFTLETSIKRAYFQALDLPMKPTKHTVSASEYRKYQTAKTLQNPVNIVELNSKLESLRVLTERRSARPSYASKLESIRTKVIVKTLDLVWKRSGRWRVEEGWNRLREHWESIKEVSKKGAIIIRAVMRAGAYRLVQRRFHKWHIATVSDMSRSRYTGLTSLNASRIPKENSDFSMSRDCVLNVSSWFLGSYLFNQLSKVFTRRISHAFQTMKTVDLNIVNHLGTLLTRVAKRTQTRALQRWSSAAQRLHLVSRMRKQCNSSLMQLHSRMQLVSVISLVGKLQTVLTSTRFRLITHTWKTLKKGKTRRNQFQTPSKRKRSPYKSPSPTKPKSPSPRPKKHSAFKEEKSHAPKKNREKKSPVRDAASELKTSIVKVRHQHACEKIARIRHKVALKSGLSEAWGVWKRSVEGPESPRFVEAPRHQHNLSFSGDEGLFEQPVNSGLSIAELRRAIAVLRRTANAH